MPKITLVQFYLVQIYTYNGDRPLRKRRLLGAAMKSC